MMIDGDIIIDNELMEIKSALETISSKLTTLGCKMKAHTLDDFTKNHMLSVRVNGIDFQIALDTLYEQPNTYRKHTFISEGNKQTVSLKLIPTGGGTYNNIVNKNMALVV